MPIYSYARVSTIDQDLSIQRAALKAAGSASDEPAFTVCSGKRRCRRQLEPAADFYCHPRRTGQSDQMTEVDYDGQPVLPLKGAVLGVDVGFSPTRRSSSVCRLDWHERRITWTFQRFRARLDEQEATILAVAGSGRLEAAAFDGPLRSGFDVVGHYRVAERMLTRRLGTRIGKPGQSSTPVGKKLNAAANDCVDVVMRGCDLAPAAHTVRIDDKAVVEAFPGAFLGVLLADPSVLAACRADRSDVFFRHLAEGGTLEGLLAYLLPGRIISSLASVTNHDDRAALVCALSALCVAAGDYTAVGDVDGWIMLPPRRFVQDWAWADLEGNACQEAPGCLHRCPAPPVSGCV